MAYLNVLLSVPDSQVKAIQADSKQLLRPTSVVSVSHMLAYAIEAEPLNRLLAEAIDGGSVLSSAYRHPMRPPVYHGPKQVRSLCKELDQAWQRTAAGTKKGDNEIVGFSEITSLVELYRHASSRGECVVSVLLPPSDVKGYEWIRMPFEVGFGKRVPVRLEGLESHLDQPQKSGGTVSLALIGSSLGGLLTAGILGLCYWRYRRKRQKRDIVELP